MKKVYITPRSITKNGHKSLKKLEEAGFELIYAKPGIQPTEEEQLEILPDCVAYLAGIEPISGRVLNKSKKLKIISRNGVGIDNIDLQEAKKLGIKVKIANGSNAQGVAELAIGLIFCSVRSIPYCNNKLKQEIWNRKKGIEIQNKTLGVIGVGNIGKRASKMALSLGMNVLAYDLYPDYTFKPSPLFKFAPLEEVLQKSNIITLHCPPGERPLIDEEALDLMKEGVILINTARANVVDNEIILRGLNSGKIRSYAVDVYEKEPPEVNALFRHTNTITTPHIGGYTKESIDRAVEAAVDNIIKFFFDEKIVIENNRVNSLEDFFINSNECFNKIELTWLGQAGFAIKSNSKTIIIDPYLSDFLSKKYKGSIFPHVRLMEPPISPESIKNIDYVFSTHPHTDHLDPETISSISKNNPECKFVVPNSEIEEAIKRGAKEENIIGANIDKKILLGEKISVIPIPAAHECFKINEKGEHSFLGYIFKIGNITLYHSGDCIPYEGLPEKLKSYKVEVALLPINGRDDYRRQNNIAGNFTISETLELCKKTGIKTLFVHHFGMFAYNTVEKRELKLLKNQSSKEIEIIIPDIKRSYQIRKKLI
jgi:phosphoglycerate dehydrogenase-like enzyme/L-ascorbate metabolism protein UlaG (beta-lactamase superfamily)